MFRFIIYILCLIAYMLGALYFTDQVHIGFGLIMMGWSVMTVICYGRPSTVTVIERGKE